MHFQPNSSSNLQFSRAMLELLNLKFGSAKPNFWLRKLLSTFPIGKITWHGWWKEIWQRTLERCSLVVYPHYLQASKHPKVIKSGCLAGFLLKSFSGLLHFIFQRSWKGIRDLEFWNLFETTPSVLTRKSLRSIVHLVGHPWIAFHRACHVQDRGLSSNVALERLKIGGSGHGCPLSPEIITWCHVSSQFI